MPTQACPRLIDGVPIPSILYGTAWKEERTERLTELALEAGYRGIDTANQRRHYFEAAVGNAVRAFLAGGRIRREELFLQTKFTSVRGQDHRLPYDPDADLPAQVRQSMHSSLDHFGVDQVDSYVLHGPESGHGWSGGDTEVWETMVALRDEGATRLLGVSNVGPHHLETLRATSSVLPAFVQNRCYARMGWDRDVRSFCTEHGIVYQGFSLLTANPEVVGHPAVRKMADRLSATPAQVVLRFAQQVGMLPLTGTTDPSHMKQDLAIATFELTAEEVRTIEALSG